MIFTGVKLAYNKEADWGLQCMGSTTLVAAYPTCDCCGQKRNYSDHFITCGKTTKGARELLPSRGPVFPHTLTQFL